MYPGESKSPLNGAITRRTCQARRTATAPGWGLSSETRSLRKASSCQILQKINFSRHIIKKYSNIKFDLSPSSGKRVVPCSETDRETDGQTGRI